MTFTTLVLDVLLLAVAYAHVLLAPYNKVEESFNLHAVHDVLAYGVGNDAISQYDHVIFPGAVPRTFAGSIALAWVSKAVIYLASSLDVIRSKEDTQIAVRLCLATVNVLSLIYLRGAVSRRFGRQTAHLFVLLSATQFHLPFWMGRTLPNMFALPPVNIAHALLLDRAPHSTKPTRRAVHAAIALLTFTTVVFRSEVLLLLGPLVLQAMVQGYTSLISIITVGLVSGVLSLALTVLVDSTMWSTWPNPLWPEFSGLYFNVLQGKSSEWGTSPPHAYLTSHLPKLLLSSTPLAILGAAVDGRVRSFLFPSVVFVGAISALAHKEWRFVVYTVPVFNVAAARGARTILNMHRTLFMGKDTFLVVFGLLSLNAAFSVLSLQASMANYPGGEALSFFNAHYANVSYVHVHISNLAAQTGASLFMQENSPPYIASFTLSQPDLEARGRNWTYDKTEGLTPFDLTNGPYTHLIVETPMDASLSSAQGSTGWKEVATIDGFAGWLVDRSWIRMVERIDVVGLVEGIKNGGPITMKREEKLKILERT